MWCCYWVEKKTSFAFLEREKRGGCSVIIELYEHFFVELTFCILTVFFPTIQVFCLSHFDLLTFESKCKYLHHHSFNAADVPIENSVPALHSFPILILFLFLFCYHHIFTHTVLLLTPPLLVIVSAFVGRCLVYYNAPSGIRFSDGKKQRRKRRKKNCKCSPSGESESVSSCS